MYNIRKHYGLRNSMAHIYNSSYGTFSDLADAIAWAHFKHDSLNNTFICLDDGTILYGIIPGSETGYYTDNYDKHVSENPWIQWSTKLYKIEKSRK